MALSTAHTLEYSRPGGVRMGWEIPPHAVQLSNPDRYPGLGSGHSDTKGTKRKIDTTISMSEQWLKYGTDTTKIQHPWDMLEDTRLARLSLSLSLPLAPRTCCISLCASGWSSASDTTHRRILRSSERLNG